jgi:hypothetical protein
MASVSETGWGAAAAGTADVGATTGCGTEFCRMAKYAPPAAAVRQPATSSPARLLEFIDFS